ncbi:hypothetical protein HY251_11810 [bacterium]|nr:hypothetical protein [bacterium]
MARSLLVILFAIACLARPAFAGDVVITVGGDQAKGAAAAAPSGGKWAPTLNKGLELAAAELEGNAEAGVVVRIATGSHDGDGKGSYQLPAINNVKASLRIEGGYKEDFSRRDPFKTPTRIVTIVKRTAPLLTVHSGLGANTDKMRSLTIDGVVFDVGNSNIYDNHGSLLQKISAPYAIIDFNSVVLESLVVQNCVFANAPQGAFQTLVRPLTDAMEIRIRNSIFLNCVVPLRLDVVRAEGVVMKTNVQRISVDHCSAAVEIGHREAAKEFVITNNVFYASFGGAILCPHKQNPKLTIKDNLFAGNGFYSATTEMGAAAMLVDGGDHREAIGADKIPEVKNVQDGEGNVTITPGIPIALTELKPFDATKVKAEKSWDDEVKRLLGTNMKDGIIKVRDFAPRKEFDPANPPLPTRPTAKRYGASPELVR